MSLRVHIQELRAPGQVLVRALELDCPPGSITTVMGPSGCGKSSVLAFVCGTLAPELHVQGQVWLHGQRVDKLRLEARKIGILFQDDFLITQIVFLRLQVYCLTAQGVFLTAESHFFKFRI